VGPARPEPEDGAPDPIRHATPDAELAEAQMALGRPELIDQADEEPDEDFDVGESAPDSEEDTGSGYGSEIGESATDSEEDTGSDNGSGFGGEAPPPSGGAELAAPGPSAAPAPSERPGLFTRLVHFLQGSWRELQRVQWPDRRQVIQATGVVIGFVIVAGVYLGIADTLASHVMNYILTGKW
jgi:preprotein translocase SecE subunit